MSQPLYGSIYEDFFPNGEIKLNEEGLISQDGKTEARFDDQKGIVFE